MKRRTVVKWTIGIVATVAVVAVGGLVCLFAVGFVSLEKGEKHRRQLQALQDSGKWDFGEQPALFAVAQGIVKNDPAAIRAAAKDVPNLQAPGRYSETLLNFAVMQSWQRPESLEAIRTLLSLGADPNYTNGNRNSSAMANAGHVSASVLRAMLDAGGNANTRDEFGRPIILMNWYLGYYPDQARSRFDLLLDRGADVNSAMPESESESAGYSLLLYRTAMGLDHGEAYADALHLLERGADPKRVAADGMDFPKMLVEHRKRFTTGRRAPVEFAPLWEWAQTHGILSQPK